MDHPCSDPLLALALGFDRKWKSQEQLWGLQGKMDREWHWSPLDKWWQVWVLWLDKLSQGEPPLYYDSSFHGIQQHIYRCKNQSNHNKLHCLNRERICKNLNLKWNAIHNWYFVNACANGEKWRLHKTKFARLRGHTYAAFIWWTMLHLKWNWVYTKPNADLVHFIQLYFRCYGTTVLLDDVPQCCVHCLCVIVLCRSKQEVVIENNTSRPGEFILTKYISKLQDRQIPFSFFTWSSETNLSYLISLTSHPW